MNSHDFFRSASQKTSQSDSIIQQWIQEKLVQQNFFNATLLDECCVFFEKKQEEQTTGISVFHSNFFAPKPISSSSEESTCLAIGPAKSITKVSDEASDEKISHSSTKPERYTLIKTLGEGGMGVVELVQDQLLGREVAMKKIKSPDFSGNISQTQHLMLWRLQTEASITSYLEHPNIVPLYDLERFDSGEIRFTMRKIEGDTLKKILQLKLKKEVVLEENKLLFIFLKVCDAVSYAHSRGIIHRDLKPDNIMVGKFGEVYVMDWGISKRILEPEADPSFMPNVNDLATNSDTELKTIGGIGTPGYMSPEQKKEASQVTFQSDIYALGKILRECFTCLSPHEEFNKVLKSYQEKEKVSVQERLNELLPVDVQAIVKKATEEKKEDRYETIQALSTDLNRYLNDVRVSVREYTGLEIFQKWVKRNQQKIRLFRFTAILFLLLIAGFFWIQRQAHKNRFQKIYQEALAFKAKADSVPESEHQAKSLKIKYLLNTLNSLNMLNFLTQFSRQTQQDKFEVGEKLIYLACETEDYTLAYHVANDLSELSEISLEKKQHFLHYIEQTQNKTLKAHQERLSYWIETLKKTGVDAEMEENAIFEIVRMKEEAIAKQVEKEVKNGIQYFTANVKRTSRLDTYYEFIANVLGRLENPKAQETLESALCQVADQIVHVQNKPLAESRFMIALVKSLQHLQSKNVAQLIERLRIDMGETSLFYRETTLAATLLAKIDGLDKRATVLPSDYVQRAMNKANQKDYTGAIEDLNQAILLSPNNYEILMQRGVFNMWSHNLDGALADYNESIRINPFQSETYSNRANLKVDIGDLDGAIEDALQSIKLDPNNIFAYNAQGVAYDRKNQFDQAIECYQGSLAIDSQHPDTYLNRAFSRKNKGDIKGAKEDCDLVLQIEPKSVSAYSVRGSLFVLENNYLQAIQNFNEAIRLAPERSDLYNKRAYAKCRTKDFLGALEDTQEGINQIQPALEQIEKTIKEVALKAHHALG
ncbi:MAG: protein kinase, partial [Planctomycetota bacterium]